jgi:hypothetical protein
MNTCTGKMVFRAICAFLVLIITGCEEDSYTRPEPTTVHGAASRVYEEETGVIAAASYTGPGPHKITDTGTSSFNADGSVSIEFDSSWIADSIEELALVACTTVRYIDTGRTWRASTGEAYELQRTELNVVLREAQTAAVVATTTLTYDGYPTVAEISNGKAHRGITWSDYTDWLSPYVNP